MPFGRYRDFAHCVKENKDKKDPRGYCGTIQRRVEGKDLTPDEEKSLTPSDKSFFKSQVEGKSYAFFTKSIGHEKVEVKGKPSEYFVHGYISTSDIDAVKDLVTRDALADMLKQVKGRNIPLKIDVEHEIVDRSNGEIRHYIPVGKIVDGRLDNKGLWVKVKLNTAIDRFKEVWGSVKNGNLDAFSITFRVKDFTYRMLNGVKTRLIHALDLINVTLTGMPINPAASITDVFAKAVRDLEGITPKTVTELKKGDPKRICGDLWFNGTPKQREAFGSGTQGRGKKEKPPKAWWDDCTRTISRAKSFEAKGLSDELKELMEVKNMGDEEEPKTPPEGQPATPPATPPAEGEDKGGAATPPAAPVAPAAAAAPAEGQPAPTEAKAITELKARLDTAEAKSTALETELKALRELPILKAAAAPEPAAPENKGTPAEQKAASPLDVI